MMGYIVVRSLGNTESFYIIYFVNCRSNIHYTKYKLLLLEQAGACGRSQDDKIK
jgi:hypothetical protein